MTEPAGVPAGTLFAALAEVQAELPPVTKGSRVETSHWTSKYADLAVISAAILPVLGKHGLAFTARPTLLDGHGFVLAYSLLHVSGEREDGVYPLSSGSAATPQQIGSLITYARRYCLCAVTGVAPAGEDEDAASANTPQRWGSAAESFENAASVKPAANGNTARPAHAERPAPTGEIDEAAQPFADEAHEARTVAVLKDVNTRARDTHKLASLIRNPASGGKGGLGQYLQYRRGVLQKADKALAELKATAQACDISMAELDEVVMTQTGHSIEDATPEEMDQVGAGLTRAVDAVAADAGAP
jgi:hypothetical protein